VLPVLTQLAASAQNLCQTHIAFLQAVLATGHYRFGARHVPPILLPDKDCTIEMVLEYYYLRGIVHAGNAEWHRAINCWGVCLTVPAAGTEAVSVWQVAAWKKRALIQCLSGEKVDTPRECSPALTRLLQSHADKPADDEKPPPLPGSPSAAARVEAMEEAVEPPAAAARQPPSYPVYGISTYQQVVQAVAELNIPMLRTLLSDHARLFAQDGNTGWAHQIETALAHRVLVHHRSLYVTVPVQTLAEQLQCSIEDTKQHLLATALERAWELEFQQTANGEVVVFPAWQPSPAADDAALLQDLLSLTAHVQTMHVSLPRKQGRSYRSEAAAAAAAGPRGVEDV
jgi:hypothetical protein